MKNKIEEILAIQKFANELRGVITLSDIKTLLYNKSASQISKRLTELENSGGLKRFIRGFYYLPNNDTNLALLSQRITPRSYASFETVLARELIIGTTPKFALSAIKVGVTRTYKNKDYRITQYGINSSLFFGYEQKESIAYATKEKAVLDILYCYCLGAYKPLVDIYSDIDYSRFDQKKLMSYLDKYKNFKFKTFVNSLLEK